MFWQLGPRYPKYLISMLLVGSWVLLLIAVGAELDYNGLSEPGLNEYRAVGALLTFPIAAGVFFRLKAWRFLSYFDLLTIGYIVVIFASALVARRDDVYFYYPLLMVSGLLILVCSRSNDDYLHRIKFYLICITFCFLTSMVILYFGLYLHESAQRPGDSLYLVGSSLAANSELPIARPTGLARSIILAGALAVVLLFSTGRHRSFVLLPFLAVFFAAFVTLEARGSMVAGLVALTFIAWKFRKEISLKTSRYLSLFLLWSIFFYFLFSFNVFDNYGFIFRSDVSSDDGSALHSQPLFVARELSHDISSGRFAIWSEILTSMSGNWLVGYGVQGDRFLIQTSASNIFIYSVASGGLVGCAVVVLLSIVILKALFDPYLGNTGYPPEAAAALMFSIIFIGARSLFETGPGVFGVDYMLLILNSSLFTQCCGAFKHKKSEER